MKLLRIIAAAVLRPVLTGVIRVLGRIYPLDPPAAK